MSITIQSKSGTRSSVEKKKPFSFNRRSVKQKELFFFLTQISLMLDVGISLSRAIETIMGQSNNEYFKEIMGT
ncbi:MAG: hypothetical protein HOJ48_15560, partial [Desulfobacula sp.]|nr:hypothetical protein [Desulfobacula sp.]